MVAEIYSSLLNGARNTTNFQVSVIFLLATWLAVWRSGNTLASINVVALRQTRLVPRWVTVSM